VSPEEKGGAGGPDDEPRHDETHDETAEYELGDDFLEDVEGEEESHEASDEEEPQGVFDHQEEEPAAEEGAEEEAEVEEEEEVEDEIEDEEDSELDQLISAETQEWDPVEAEEEVEEEGEEEEEEEEEEPEEAEPEPVADKEPTLVASAGARLGEARAKVTPVLEKARGWRPRPGFPLWLKFLTASVVIVFSVAGAASASLILYLGDIAGKLKDPTGALAGADKFLTTVDGGGPQTILILGSDKDPELKDVQKGFRGLSDTTMLLRLDPHRDAIALFSLPRDLEVQIPGYGTDKLNAAYGFGGPQLTLQTVEELLSQTGQPFEVNHLVNVDFEGFARAVNEIDCVYVDVDHRYFHSNDNTSAAQDYEEIDLQPGYQALCGFDALDYARYRHTDNDIIRAARQQEFLREARAKVPPDKLIDDRKDLIAIFTEHTTSDINDPQTMLQVLKLMLDARDAPIKEVHFEGTIGPSFVTTTTQELRRAVNQFFGFEASGQGGQTAAPDEPVAPEAAPDQVAPTTPAAPAKPAEGGNKAKAPAPKPAEEPPPSTGGSADNDVSLTSVEEFSRGLARSVRARAAPRLPVFYPTQLEPGSDFAQKPRVYKVNGTGEGSPPQGERAAYKYVFTRPALGEYYGFTATAWKDPPILEDPDTTREVGDREYQIFLDGDRVRMVAWQDDNGSYWLSNTLIESLSNEEMLQVAKSIKELPRPSGE
jgi:LCP family protein required for cell wall assembly